MIGGSKELSIFLRCAQKWGKEEKYLEIKNGKLIVYDVDNDYRNYLRKETIINEILEKTEKVLKILENEKHTDYQFFKQICCDYQLLEQKCQEYIKYKN